MVDFKKFGFNEEIIPDYDTCELVDGYAKNLDEGRSIIIHKCTRNNKEITVIYLQYVYCEHSGNWEIPNVFFVNEIYNDEYFEELLEMLTDIKNCSHGIKR